MEGFGETLRDILEPEAVSCPECRAPQPLKGWPVRVARKCVFCKCNYMIKSYSFTITKGGMPVRCVCGAGYPYEHDWDGWMCECGLCTFQDADHAKWDKMQAALYRDKQAQDALALAGDDDGEK